MTDTDSDVCRIILIYKLLCQSVVLGLGLALSPKFLALALKLKSLALALQPALDLHLAPCGLVNITGV